jgi:hypothetical protein
VLKIFIEAYHDDTDNTNDEGAVEYFKKIMEIASDE